MFILLVRIRIPYRRINLTKNYFRVVKINILLRNTKIHNSNTDLKWDTN